MVATPQQLHAAFHPRTIAVVGAKKSANYNWLRNMQTFTGKLYSVQVDPNEIPGIEELGIPNYRSLAEIPEEIDYVCVAVPRRVVPAILKDAIAKKVKTVHLFTSGFAESKTEEGITLQQTVIKMSKEGGLTIVGPNCMGIFNAANGMRFYPYQIAGQVGRASFVAQSGAHAGAFTQAAQSSGIAVNKAVSIGNAIMVDSSDLLDYFAQDEGTHVITMYIEGPKSGRALFDALKRTTPKKPVVVWKGGQTEDGQRASASHTGALAASMDIWNAMVRQAGAVRADSMEEAIDMTKTLLYLKAPAGPGLGIIGGSGGQGVEMSDAFSKEGLRVPRLSQASLDKLGSFFQLIGASYFNPMDVGGLNRSMFDSIVETLTTDPVVDAVVTKLNHDALDDDGRQRLDTYLKYRDITGKPFLAVLSSPNPYRDGQALFDLDKALLEKGIPSFPSPERAAKALRRLMDYQAFKAGVAAS